MRPARITAEPGVPFIDIELDFAAPRALVYRAHVEPDLVAQWLGPARYRTIVERMEVRDGGRWRFVHRGAGGEEQAFRGVFHGEPSVEGITQTWEYEGWPGRVSLERLTFEERDGRTTLRAHTVYQSILDRDEMVASGMEGGVNEGYARLDGVLERLVRGT